MPETMWNFLKRTLFLLIALGFLFQEASASAFVVTGTSQVAIGDQLQEHALVMGDRAAPKKAVVFTDPDCPYCAKLHSELKKIVERRDDIAFYIKLFPLATHKDAYRKSKSILCISSLLMLEDSFAGIPIPTQDCKSDAVDRTVTLAQSLGINALPTIIFPDGRRQVGYVPMETITAYLDSPSVIAAPTPRTAPTLDPTDLSVPAAARASHNAMPYAPPSIAYTAQEQRTALVIGNSAYSSGPLKNPVNDVTDMAAMLKKLGFNVTLKKDVGLREMEEVIEVFGNNLKRGGVGLFYYAGHGMQVNGTNYLLPIGTRINKESDVKYQAVDANRILDEMATANNGLNIVMLDACRDNPYARSFRNAARGLAIVSSAPSGTFISYSTSPGNVARDGDGRNSPYTAALLQYIQAPGHTIGDVFINVRTKVKRETGQVPWELSSLEGQFYFNPSGSAQNNQPAASTGQKEALERERQELAREKQEIERQKTLDAEREQLATERRKIEAERQQLAMGKRPFSSTTEETTRLEATKSLAEKNKQEGDLFHAENKKKEGVLTLRSGLQLKVIKEGTGNKPKVTDTITVNYRGTLIDGKEFDSSYRRGEPATFSVNGVISGWKEALLLMKVGAKWQLFIPSNLAYGEKGVGNIIGPNATLLFEVELISIK